MSDNQSDQGVAYIDSKIQNIKNFIELENLYNEWSKTYDEDLSKPNTYSGFIMISKLLDLFSFRNKSRRILDIGAGTGLVAEELKKLGYNNIDALESNAAMIGKAKEKDLYLNYFEIFLKPNENIKTIPEETYDRITMAGVFSPAHLDYRHIKPILKLLKSGGFLITGLRYSNLENHQKELIPEIERLEKEKFIKITMLSEIPDYYPGISAFAIVLEKV